MMRSCAQLAVVAGAVVAASCGVDRNALPASHATPTPVPGFFTIPPAGGTVTAPAAGGLGVSFVFAPGAAPGTTGVMTSTTNAPPGVPAPGLGSGLGSVAPASTRRTRSIAGAISFLYVTVTVNEPVSASLFLNELLPLTADLAPSSGYDVEIDTPNASPPEQLSITGTVHDGVVTFTNANGTGTGLQTLQPGQSYTFQFYEIPAGTESPGPLPSATATATASATPSPAPTASPTPTPTPTPVASPGELDFDVTNPVAQTFSVAEAGNAAAFTAAIACTENPAGQTPAQNAFVATIAPASATPATPGGAVSFTVTPGAETGTCTATVTDAHGNVTAVTVTVSNTSLNIFGNLRT